MTDPDLPDDRVELYSEVAWMFQVTYTTGRKWEAEGPADGDPPRAWWASSVPLRRSRPASRATRSRISTGVEPYGSDGYTL